MYALIDCNNFFVSCERIFRPDLEGKPVVVMSNNDGVVVARSNEAKNLGIPMCAPEFKYRDFFRQNKVVQFSANFELYGDISRRIVDLLTSVTPRIEVYSIDESFLDLSQLPIKNYEEWGRVVSQRIHQWIGVPVSIGIAPTKTLAKLSADYAKKHAETGGTYVFERDSLAKIPLESVWGVGYRLSPKLRAEGMMNALQLSQLSPQRADQLMGVHGRRLVAELNGTSCYALEREGGARKSIARTRTFGTNTSSLEALCSAMANFTARAAYGLRESGQAARHLSIFMTTSKHKPGYRRLTNDIHLGVPTADTGQLTKIAVDLMQEIYNPNLSYHRAGVILDDFVPDYFLQTDILGMADASKHDRSARLMQSVDEINSRFGKGKISSASEKLDNSWRSVRHNVSPSYVAKWTDLPKARVKIRGV